MSVKSYNAAKTAASSSTTATPAPAAAATPAPAAATTPAPAAAATPAPAAAAKAKASSEEEVVKRISASVIENIKNEGVIKDHSDRIKNLEDENANLKSENENLKSENRALWKAIGKFLRDHEKSDWDIATDGVPYTSKGEPILSECWPIYHNGKVVRFTVYEQAKKVASALSEDMPKSGVVWVDPLDDNKFYKELEFDEAEKLEKEGRLDRFNFIDDPDDFDDEE